MNKKPFLSVIIPTYNVEKYIEMTLNSLAVQSFRNYEIIIVDDASTDNTVRRCVSFKERNQSIDIEIFQLNHGGVSKARNFGIQKAKGEYLHFLDSDDEIVPDMYEIFYEISKKLEYDLIVGSVNIVRPSGTIVQSIKQDIDCPIEAKIVKWLRELSVAEKGWMLNVVWNKWFNLDIIRTNNLQYKDICPGEDYEFVMRYIAYCKSVYISSKPIYKYYQRGITSLLSRKYSHKSQIERRTVNWTTTQDILTAIGVFNPTFLIAEGYSLYNAIYDDMRMNQNKNNELNDYFNLPQYDCLILYFKTRRSFASSIVSTLFSTKNALLINMFFKVKFISEKSLP